MKFSRSIITILLAMVAVETANAAATIRGQNLKQSLRRTVVVEEEQEQELENDKENVQGDAAMNMEEMKDDKMDDIMGIMTENPSDTLTVSGTTVDSTMTPTDVEATDLNEDDKEEDKENDKEDDKEDDKEEDDMGVIEAAMGTEIPTGLGSDASTMTSSTEVPTEEMK